ncbi:extracellular solute-binding protein [Actinoplanes sp. LDG1-06]|uniref:Extracellular solute-binding protein n=1 Tax=Paractinoplanes ovalisporus TaxID=2810368 RepID=A0ABS2AFI2_9ACTN|nr:extracellular solute-binding protein [Actinoplanes ovalisporus]MBM2618585.1 extracellular solute-binding protein [Actinoplanes ovalisporus]
MLTDADEGSQSDAKAMVAAFQKANPGVVVDVQAKPSGTDGDNLIKTRLQTGTMTDVFTYGSGSLFQQIAPANNLAALTGDAAVAKVDEAYLPQVSVGSDVYGVPWGNAFAGGVMYNKKVFEQLNLQVPKSWSEFLATADKIKAAKIAPVIQTYGETWTSQLFVLGDFHNVAAAAPQWAADYTANKAKYATTPAALAGFEHLQEVHDKGLMNSDFASAKVPDGLRLLASGKGAMYPILSGVLPQLEQVAPDNVDDIGFFALPGPDAATNGLTAWFPNGVYIPKSTSGPKLEAAKKFLGFVASPAGCEVMAASNKPTGPFMVQGCSLPADVPQVTKDIQTYFDEKKQSPALEFLSPVKGPNLEQLCVEVGSGISKADKAAALYDQDVKKQAQQLGLEGW